MFNKIRSEYQRTLFQHHFDIFCKHKDIIDSVNFFETVHESVVHWDFYKNGYRKTDSKDGYTIFLHLEKAAYISDPVWAQHVYNVNDDNESRKALSYTLVHENLDSEKAMLIDRLMNSGMHFARSSYYKSVNNTPYNKQVSFGFAKENHKNQIYTYFVLRNNPKCIKLIVNNHKQDITARLSKSPIELFYRFSMYIYYTDTNHKTVTGVKVKNIEHRFDQVSVTNGQFNAIDWSTFRPYSILTLGRKTLRPEAIGKFGDFLYRGGIDFENLTNDDMQLLNMYVDTVNEQT